MPGLDGRLSEAEKDAIRRRIDELWRGSANCPICGSSKWIISDHIVDAPIVTEGVRGFGSAYPFILLTSETCGYTLHFSAVILGIAQKARFI